jgi:regulatory protein
MGKIITALSVQKRNPNRVNIYLDGEFAFGLTRLVAAWLKVGQELSEEKIDRLLKDDSHEVVFQKIMHFMSYRPRTEKEIRQHMQNGGYEAELLDAVIDQMKAKGLINDLTFAKTWIDNRSIHRPRGHKALAMELQQKGVDRGAIEDVLAGMGDEKEMALVAARKYVHRLEVEDWTVFRVKLSAFLGRRGFNYETISETVRQVWKEVQTSKE